MTTTIGRMSTHAAGRGYRRAQAIGFFGAFLILTTIGYMTLPKTWLVVFAVPIAAGIIVGAAGRLRRRR